MPCNYIIRIVLVQLFFVPVIKSVPFSLLVDENFQWRMGQSRTCSFKYSWNTLMLIVKQLIMFHWVFSCLFEYFIEVFFSISHLYQYLQESLLAKAIYSITNLLLTWWNAFGRNSLVALMLHVLQVVATQNTCKTGNKSWLWVNIYDFAGDFY